MPEIKAVQFSPGVGGPGAVECIPMFRRIQKAGTSVHCWVPPKDIEHMIRELSPKGLSIETSCGSPEEADALLKKVETWTAARLRHTMLD